MARYDTHNRTRVSRIREEKVLPCKAMSNLHKEAVCA